MLPGKPNEPATMPSGIPAGFSVVYGREIVHATQSFIQENFVADTYREYRIQPGEQMGPLFRVCSDEQFRVQNTPQSYKEVGHFCGFRKPISPLDAKNSWALGPWNTAEYCQEFYIRSFE